MSKIIACIDGSPLAGSVCDHGAWLARRLALPLTLLHVLERSLYPTAPDASGAIGLGSREHLLKELARLDEQRARLARADGAALLAGAVERLQGSGLVTAPATLQRHDYLVDTLRELEADMSLLVIGKRGEHAGRRGIGSQLETVVRTLHKPILVCAADFREPQRFLLAMTAARPPIGDCWMSPGAGCWQGCRARSCRSVSPRRRAWPNWRPLRSSCVPAAAR